MYRYQLPDMRMSAPPTVAIGDPLPEHRKAIDPHEHSYGLDWQGLMTMVAQARQTTGQKDVLILCGSTAYQVMSNIAASTGQSFPETTDETGTILFKETTEVGADAFIIPIKD